ncbi:exo-alpha-sialidase [Lacipirellula parvula]|uniref:Sialidase domain-containing protein n=1 Tax=Lacipirellula parvula TaxID=2650471 RepID=A0A5K7X7V4_9BACT|nr:exo-alpha-sialidase [Lacipirellula parvula]BBO32854.1 hypothetical protein PLANPX_2466 [Lacipirellula parvula]
MLTILSRVSLLIATWLLLQPVSRAEEATPQARLVSVQRIWGEAPHSAFTDLLRWRDEWICGFREGQNHVGSQGAIRILHSKDGEQWTSLSQIKHDTYDLRDASLSVTPEGKLMLVAGAAQVLDGKRQTGSLVYFSTDGANWTQPELISEMGRWMWAVTWHDNVAWGVAYPAPKGMNVSSLLNSSDGVHFKPVVEKFLADSKWPTEARIRFGRDGEALCLHRTDSKRNFAFLGAAVPPYTEWKWKELDRFIGGPNLLQLPSGEWVAAGRIHNPKPVTALVKIDRESGHVTPLLELPSGGDTSYPGLVWHEGLLWMSYYSSHEGKTQIYLAKIELPQEK